MNEEENIFHFLLGRNLFIFCFVIENRPTHTHRRWLEKKECWWVWTIPLKPSLFWGGLSPLPFHFLWWWWLYRPIIIMDIYTLDVLCVCVCSDTVSFQLPPPHTHTRIVYIHLLSFNSFILLASITTLFLFCFYQAFLWIASFHLPPYPQFSPISF